MGGGWPKFSASRNVRRTSQETRPKELATEKMTCKAEQNLGSPATTGTSCRSLREFPLGMRVNKTYGHGSKPRTRSEHPNPH